MKVIYIQLFLLVTPIFLKSQSLTFNESTLFSLGASASFTAGGDANFIGTLRNNGTIVAQRDLNFFTNRQVGNLKFTGDGDQELFGDTLQVGSMEVDKTGNVKVSAEQILVAGNLNVTAGVIQTEDIDDLIVTGETNEDGSGYVEGTLVGFSQGSPVAFPMGVNGNRNTINLSNAQSGTVLIVNCTVPNPNALFPTEDMVGIADEVEWQIRTLEGTAEVTLSTNFSGLDFVNFSNGEPIAADIYAPAFAIIQQDDTVHMALVSTTATPSGTNPGSTKTSGSIVSNTTITIDTAVTRINVAWLPFKDAPEIFVPNAFAPSGFQKENRIFRPFLAGAEATQVSMRIFDSFNKEVYAASISGESIDLSTIGWDGKLPSGLDAPEGVYFYQIFVESPDLPDDQKNESGSVLLVK
ncbi:MAG: hypothetical protein AAF789_00945 [Bacteroidota bacterium]